MATEIERKFLVDPQKLPPLPQPLMIQQGYIPSDDATIRIRTANDRAYLTLKGKTTGFSRSEFEYPVPFDDAVAMLAELCREPLIEKRRYEIHYGAHLWEVDVFEGENRGLVLAEVELVNESETVELPPWVTSEVTHDKRYYNARLRLHPFSRF